MGGVGVGWEGGKRCEKYLNFFSYFCLGRRVRVWVGLKLGTFFWKFILVLVFKKQLVVGGGGTGWANCFIKKKLVWWRCGWEFVGMGSRGRK